MSGKTLSAPTTNVEKPVDELTARKLSAFARIEEEFIASFIFVQAMHGQRRFEALTAGDVVRYLHALYLCEVKDRLLGVHHSIERYEGERTLQLLRDWQKGQTAEVIVFLQYKLGNLPFGELSRQIEQVARAGDTRMTQRLAAGRLILLNREINLARALEALITPEPEALLAEVRAQCKRLGHAPATITRQLAALQTDLYSYAPSASLARRNMLLMNRLGMQIADGRTEPRIELRADRMVSPAPPPFAEEIIPGQTTLVSLSWISATAASD